MFVPGDSELTVVGGSGGIASTRSTTRWPTGSEWPSTGFRMRVRRARVATRHALSYSVDPEPASSTGGTSGGITEALSKTI